MSAGSLAARPWVCAAALIFLSLAAYVPAAGGDFFWDDESYIVDNRAVREAGGLSQIWLDPQASPQYYPLAFTSFWLEHRLWGLNPAGYHATNILLHAINVLLLWVVLRRMGVPGAALAAAVFAVHPVHVESVAWITERKNLLSTTFYLAAVLCWLRYLQGERLRDYSLVVGFFLGAMLSKTAACTLPISLGLIAWWRHPVDWRRLLRLLVPLLIIAVALGLVTVWRENLSTYTDIETAPLSPVDRTLIAVRAFWFYLGKLVWPVGLAPIYPRWETDAAVMPYLLLLATVGVYAALWGLVRRIGKGPFAAAAFFALTLAPVLGLVPFSFQRLSFVADHFQYLASAAPIALVAALLVRNAEIGRLPLLAVRVGGGALVLILSILTWRQAALYRDAAGLWRDNLAKNPGSASVRSNLGSLLERRGDNDGALQLLTAAVELQPRYLQAQYNLANVLAKRGDTQAATEHYEAALQLKPDFAPAHYGLGTILMRPQTLHRAATHLQKAVELKPDYGEAHYQLGIVRFAQGDIPAARQCFTEAVRLQPDSPEAHNNLGAALFQLGDVQGAVEQYRTVVRLKPDHARAHYNLGLALARQGKGDEAMSEMRQALRADPLYIDAHRDLAALLETFGRREEAIVEYEEALRLQPMDPRAQQGLARLLPES